MSHCVWCNCENGHLFACPTNVGNAEIARLTAEVEQCRFWNESVRVCADHTDEIVGDGCVVCDMERLQAAVEAFVSRHDQPSPPDWVLEGALRNALRAAEESHE